MPGAAARSSGLQVARLAGLPTAIIARAHIDNPQLLLRPGMLLTVHLTAAERPALMVPESALVQRSAEVFVYVIEDGRAARRTVRHGIRADGWVEILAGLAEGEAVITEGVIKVRQGAPVEAHPSSHPRSDADQTMSMHRANGSASGGT